MEVKTARKLLKTLNFCTKRVVPGILIVIPILMFVHSKWDILNLPDDRLLVIAWLGMIPLLIVLYWFEEVLEGIINRNKRDQFIEEDNWEREHHRGKRVVITEKNSGETIGTISNEQLRFLIDAFTEEGMEENDFYFINELFGLFVKEKKPDPSLIEFIRNALKDKDEIILHWEKK